MVSFGIEFLANEPAEKLAELVAHSEENGLEYAWITDHYNNRDSFSLLTYIAARTKTIKLGTGVTNPYTRTAVQLASAVATVNEVSEGRAVLGIGPGDRVTFDSPGIEWEKPLETIRETVDVIRQMQTGKKISYDGNILKIRSAKLNFGKGSNIPPVYIGAQGPNMLKKAGYDAAIIEGKAEASQYLLISDDGCELHDTNGLWGKGTKETCATLEKKHNGKAIAIGQAGEKLSLISSVIVNGHRALGRAGIGAVMGSKNLKAVVARGNQKIPIANEEKFERAVFEANALIKEKYASGRQGCYGCPIVCGHMVKFPDGKEFKSPEFETDWAFGADCDNSDFRTIVEAGELCDDYGLDTISAGATVAAAMELEEKGKIHSDLKWGDGDAIIKAVRMIGKGEGIGAEMAQGSKRFCAKYGAPELSMSVKGLELPAYDPRGAQGHGLAYATSNRGGCHLRGYMISPEILGTPKELINRFSTLDKARWTIDMQDLKRKTILFRKDC